MVDGESGRSIVLAIDGDGRIGAQHGESCLRSDRGAGGVLKIATALEALIVAKGFGQCGMPDAAWEFKRVVPV
ncbi:hypothetical protein Cmtc_05360 [Cupriavidus sp. TKC]|nr:hypothetical protein Cmtc_05360 [Cupriavidus sp. TKC]